MQERWKGKACVFSEAIGISESKASRILSGKQEPTLELLSYMAAIVGLKVNLLFGNLY